MEEERDLQEGTASSCIEPRLKWMRKTHACRFFNKKHILNTQWLKLHRTDDLPTTIKRRTNIMVKPTNFTNKQWPNAPYKRLTEDIENHQLRFTVFSANNITA